MATAFTKIETPKRWRAQDTSGNNNHGQIYSGRGLEFDGVADSLTVTTDVDSVLPHMIVSGTFTVACWLKFASLKDSSAWYASYTDGNSRVGLDTGNAGELSFTTFNGSYTYTSNITPALAINTWYRVICVLSSGTPKLYINGVERTESTTANPNALASLTSDKFNIGEINSVYFDGQMSDFQSWDAAWSADDVAFDYANPEQLALNRGGTSLTESNLKIWYPMNDGHRGQQSYVLDASNTGLGDELANNGDLSSGTTGFVAEDSDGDVTISSSTEQTYGGNSQSLKVTTTASPDGVICSITGKYISGVTYKASAWIYTNKKINLNPDDDYFADSGNIVSSTKTNEWEEVICYMTCDNTSGSNPTDALFIQSSESGSTTFYIGNLSIKPVNDKNHATTVFYGDELIANSGFETDVSNWSAQGSVASGPTHNTSHAKVGAESMSFVADAAEEGVTSAKYTTVTGRRYKVDFWAKPLNSETKIRHVIMEGDGSGWINAADFTLSSYSTATGTVGSGNWYNLTYEYTEASGGTDAEIRILSASDDSDGTFAIDEVSIKEVGTASGWTDADQQLDIPQTALQSYNQLAWFGGGPPNDGVEIGSDSDVDDIWASGGTISASFLTNGIGENSVGRIIDKISWMVYIHSVSGSTAKLQFKHTTGGTDDIEWVSTDRVITFGKWMHVVVVWDSDSATNDPVIYLNGESIALTEGDSSYGSVSDDSSHNLFIGNNNSDNRAWEGAITEVSMWNDEFTQAEVNELYNDGKALDARDHSAWSLTNLKGYWKNNGLATWTDLSNYGNNGTVIASETILQQAGVDASRDCQGFLMNRQKDTNALNLADGLDTVDDVDNITYAAMSDNPLDLSEDFSVSLWFKPHRQYSSGIQSFIQLNDDDANHFTVGMPGDDQKIGASIETTAGGLSRSVSASNDATNIGEGKWTHVVVCGSSGVSTGNNSATLVDSGAAWIVDELIGGRVWDDTDNQGATITDNTATVVTGALSGSDDWDTDDKYTITKVYVNGSVNTQTIIDNTGMPAGTDSDNTYFIGSDNTAQRQVNGQIDDVLCYQKWLTAAEVKRNYNAGKRSHR